jgi:hypothetical protein
MSNNEDGNDYATEVRNYTDEELLTKERSKRRRKTGDVVGTGLTAAAALSSPGLWAVAGAGAKSFLSNSSKHKILLKEISRRGLEPVKGNLSDAILPILTSAGSMAVGRAFGGTAGQGVASMAGNIMHNVGNRALGGVPKDQKKDKTKKNSQPSVDHNSSSAMVQCTPQSQYLQTPSVYQFPTDQTPPATLVYQYVPPSAQYPRGYYAPAPPQMASTVFQQAPQPAAQPQQYLAIEQPQTYQQMPPSLAYQYAPSQPQYYDTAPQVVDERGMPVQGIQRAQSIYGGPPPSYQPRLQRAHTIAYRQ